MQLLLATLTGACADEMSTAQGHGEHVRSGFFRPQLLLAAWTWACADNVSTVHKKLHHARTLAASTRPDIGYVTKRVFLGPSTIVL